MSNSELIPLSRVSGGSFGKRDLDTIRSATLDGGERSRGCAVLDHARQCYVALDRFRRDRERNKRYNYGDQWGDIICVDGREMTEEQYLVSQGQVPLKNNLIRRLVRNVVGVYRSQYTEPTCMARDRDEQKIGETMSTVLQYNMQLNRMVELNARTLEEFLISGMAVHRKYYGWRHDKEDCWTDYVQPANFFVDPDMRDPRMWDCRIVGEIHDIDFLTLLSQFAKSPGDTDRLSEIYRGCSDRSYLQTYWNDFGYSNEEYTKEFLTPSNPGLCRVIEVWRMEAKPRYKVHDWNSGEYYKIDVEDYEEMVLRENESRLRRGLDLGLAEDDIPLLEAVWFMDNYWYYYFLSPMGDILEEGETPYLHKGHPYSFICYPYIDGEVHSFVGDVIDQQRYTNRLIMMHDWIMRSSAKGLLLVPEDCIPDGVRLEDFADTWARYNGILVYKPSKYGQLPQQVSSNSTNIGISELLNLQLKLFEDISGVNGALQGKPGYSGMSASLYSQQTQNATTSLLDILEAFSGFLRESAYKDVKNIQQFYSDRRIINIAGRSSVIVYDPDKIADCEFDLSIVPSTSTPVYRAIANDLLMQIFQGGQITLRQMLEAGDFPFADSLIQSIDAEAERQQQQQAEAMAQQQPTQGMPPQDGGQMPPQGGEPDPRAMEMLQQALGRGEQV